MAAPKKDIYAVCTSWMYWAKGIKKKPTPAAKEERSAKGTVMKWDDYWAQCNKAEVTGNFAELARLAQNWPTLWHSAHELSHWFLHAEEEWIKKCKTKAKADWMLKGDKTKWLLGPEDPGVDDNLKKNGLMARQQYYDELDSQSSLLPVYSYQGAASPYQAQSALAYQQPGTASQSTDYALVLAMCVGLVLIVYLICCLVSTVMAAGCYLYGQTESNKQQSLAKYRRVIQHDEEV
mmetsp:Transcript_20243/g.32161  ORF Transcript_20243/g.32161 Transcript_20243/m.32161 type:complete len:235 (+) Transcript_20243:38-742(+)